MRKLFKSFTKVLFSIHDSKMNLNQKYNNNYYGIVIKNDKREKTSTFVGGYNMVKTPVYVLPNHTTRIADFIYGDTTVFCKFKSKSFPSFLTIIIIIGFVRMNLHNSKM